uniref:Ribosomal protein S3 n=1 Tax=Tolypocladium inflatum TaxID=29910 RepID=A0A2H4N0K0_TOLIN|nr:ribosomal protein S3 [Tolypocladium inflatum]ATU31921.1 ribosomal protein S3 [Tolypocladium inflatum]ATU31936.1 ribosomal protein S3 [Tolypocladium inflatum]ATU31951.1 ribosomal protein S3 [Tolypocladium inflatum]ATU31966.1 ribosomal protein S3 [Tolypocladium inflatum]ATU31981.1 ribosomal protein S3 [Tolypocladium inflatum]
MKVFNNNLKNIPKTIALRNKVGDIGKTKYLPSFSKEWKNIVYSYNKNNLKNIPVNDVNINKIIQSYFNLYFKDHKYVGSKKFILLRRRRNFLRRIYVSNAEIKHTNNKAIITLFTVNREKKILKKKYLKINKKVSKNLIKRYFLLYKNNITRIYEILNKQKNEYAFISDKISKRKFLTYKLEYLNKFIELKNLYLKKVWSIIISKYWKTYLRLLRKYDLMYSLNQYKFNKQMLLPILSNILNKIIGKKVEYNIINLKSIAYNTDLFTNALSLKLKKKRMNYIKSMFSILNRAYLPKINTIKERTLAKNVDLFLDKYKDLKIISNLGASSNNNLDKLLGDSSNTKEVHNTIYNSIGYKNMGGIRLEVKGRLTKRYRADRSIYSLKWKGGLKNVDSSFKRLSSVLFRGNSKSNVSYSLSNSKRRIGAFAVKGWISGK